jgi:hypothetical protein
VGTFAIVGACSSALEHCWHYSLSSGLKLARCVALANPTSRLLDSSDPGVFIVDPVTGSVTTTVAFDFEAKPNRQFWFKLGVHDIAVDGNPPNWVYLNVTGSLTGKSPCGALIADNGPACSAPCCCA